MARRDEGACPCGPVTEEQRSHRPNGAQPGGRQVFSAQAALLAPHRPVEGMLVGRALPAPKIPCRERHPIYVHDHLESPDSRNELWRFYAPFPQSWQGDFPQFSFWISERSCGRFARGVATSDLTAENAKSAKRRGYGVFARNPESFRGAIRGLNPELIEKAGERYWREIDRYAELSEFVGEACRHLRRSQRRRTLIRAFWQQAELSL